MVLYAKTDERLVTYNTFQMSNNTISVKTLDLNQNFLHIINNWMTSSMSPLKYRINRVEYSFAFSLY